MHLREFPTAVWEVLFGKLEARHQARLFKTGDAMVAHALVHTWRSTDLLMANHDSSDYLGEVATSSLVKHLLVKYARRLTMTSEDFSFMDFPLPLLTSLHLGQTSSHSETPFPGMSDVDGDPLLPVILDLATATPNLQSLRLDLHNPDVQFVLPVALQSLEFRFFDFDDPLCHFLNLDDLINLTTLHISANTGGALLHDRVLLPPNLTHLMTDTAGYDIVLNSSCLPATLRSLHVINPTDDAVDTGIFANLPLTELDMEDDTGAGVRLTTVPSSLTRLRLEALLIDADGESFVRAVRELPKSLTSLTIDTVDDNADNVESIITGLTLLLPLMGLNGIVKLASRVAWEHMLEPKKRLFTFLLDALKQFGDEGVKAALELNFACSVANADFDVMPTLVRNGRQIGLSTSAMANVLKERWMLTDMPVLSDLHSETTKLLYQSIEIGAISDIQVGSSDCCTLPSNVAYRLVNVNVFDFCVEQMDKFLSVEFSNLANLSVFSATSSSHVLVPLVCAILERRRNLPSIETIYLNFMTEETESPLTATVKQAMAGMNMYPTYLSGMFKYRVSPPVKLATQ